jgi:putative membrane protein
MKKKLIFESLIVASLAVACNSSGNGSSSTDSSAVKTDSGTSSMGADTGSSTKKIEANPVSVSKADSTFMIAAANAGMTEVTLGNIAVSNSANDKVKEFGQMMIKDHTTAGDQLKKIAGTRNIMLPDSLSKESRKHVNDMEKKKGKDFDRAYINMMVEGHQKVLKQFEEEQQKGSDSELKAFVSQTIPVIKGHLDAVKSIKESMK